jgi:nicotinate phosphoribosyltransferase
MEGGERLPAGEVEPEAARERRRYEVARLPERLGSIETAEPPFEVVVSGSLRRHQEEVADRVRGG